MVVVDCVQKWIEVLIKKIGEDIITAELQSFSVPLPREASAQLQQNIKVLLDMASYLIAWAQVCESDCMSPSARFEQLTPDS
eukprot:5958102-Pyramimonas_sp.AAC.1